jgi:hypothetical protein
MEVIEKRAAQIPEFNAVVQKVKADLINEKKKTKKPNWMPKPCWLP